MNAEINRNTDVVVLHFFVQSLFCVLTRNWSVDKLAGVTRNETTNIKAHAMTKSTGHKTPKLARKSAALELARRLAKADAQTFVDEFAEELDPSQTDWDGTAWSLCDLGEYENLRDELWGAYQSELIAETRGLSGGK
jgi:hypothetical protein